MDGNTIGKGQSPASMKNQLAPAPPNPRMPFDELMRKVVLVKPESKKPTQPKAKK
jgi:hypothetical protein